MSKAIIHFSREDVSKPLPWPIGLTDENVVTTGLGPDDGALLIGFGPVGTQSIDVLPEDARNNPESVKGLSPSFAKDGSLFEWSVPVAEFAIVEA